MTKPEVALNTSRANRLLENFPVLFVLIECYSTSLDIRCSLRMICLPAETADWVYTIYIYSASKALIILCIYFESARFQT